MSYREKFLERLALKEGVVETIEPVDLFDFVFGGEYLHLPSLLTSQSLALKLYYRQWEKHPFSDRELSLLSLLDTKWGIHYDLEMLKDNWTEVFQLVWGRRSSKSSLIACVIAPYEAYKLICKGNPQQHYGILQSDTIYLQVTAAKEDQAKKTFSLGSGIIKASKFFEKYIDNRKDLETELRLCSPYDLLRQKQVAEWNASRPKNTPPRKPPLGSIVFWTTTTAAGTSRGGATLLQVFEEFAHVRRARMVNGEDAGSGGMSDHELYKALAPATKTFQKDGKLIEISSPKEEGGEFYAHYSIGMGNAEHRVPPNPNYMVMQLASWEANESIKREDLQNEFEKDPLGAAQEYGGEFGKPSASFIPQEKLLRMVQHDKAIVLQGNLQHRYVVALDPASRGDTYACGWGHQEIHSGVTHYYIDGLMGWMPRIEKGIDGTYQTHPIDHNEVLNFVAELCTRALARRVMVIAYDQWQSTGAIDSLKRMKLPAMETTFTNSYKALIYRDLLEEINNEHVHVYGQEAQSHYDWVRTMLLELQYLQRVTRGDITTFHHPSSGPVQHDDFSDICAQIVSLLKRFGSNQMGLMKEMRGSGMGPMRLGRSLKPGRGARL